MNCAQSRTSSLSGSKSTATRSLASRALADCAFWPLAARLLPLLWLPLLLARLLAALLDALCALCALCASAGGGQHCALRVLASSVRMSAFSTHAEKSTPYAASSRFSSFTLKSFTSL